MRYVVLCDSSPGGLSGGGGPFEWRLATAGCGVFVSPIDDAKYPRGTLLCSISLRNWKIQAEWEKSIGCSRLPVPRTG